MATNPLKQLNALGQSVWLDSIRRSHIQSGELKKLIDADGISGETANPAIFEKAIAGSPDYDDAIAALARAGKSSLEIYETLAIQDVQSACDVFRPVYDATRGADGFVSIEVNPKLAHDTRGTIAEAKRFFAAVHRPNVMIKIPGTKAGVPAIEECLYQGININITLLFSIAAHEAVAWAYVRALERRAAEGKPIDRIASVASFFVSRIDTLADKLLADKMKTTTDAALQAKLEALGGKAAIANAKMAYALFKQIFGDTRFIALKAKGARVQRPLWASTSTKNPHYPATLYVDTLIGRDTINTLPMETIIAFREQGTARATIEEDVAGAEKVLRELAEVGLSLDAITAQVLDEGVVKFDDALDALLKSVEAKRATVIATLNKVKGKQSPTPSVIARSEATKQSPSYTEIASPHELRVARNDMTTALGKYQKDFDAALADADKNKTVERIWKRDPFLWKPDPKNHGELADRLGWLTIASEMKNQLHDLEKFADEIKRAGFKDVVLCGIGGSALCVDVLRVSLGNTRGQAPRSSRNFPTLHVLDSIAPATIRALERKIVLKKTLFVIASKSGGTTETLTQFKYFRSRAADSKQFIAITDAGSALDQLAQEYNFRRVFLNSPEIGGRFSALSYFGLVPAALMGIDLAPLLARAQEMRAQCENTRAEENPGARLGIALAVLAKQGRDKVTLVASPGIDMFGVWAEQLIAESTGKEGKGIVPIDREPLAAATAYGDDRVFVFLEMHGARNQEIEKRLGHLGKAGHPVLRFTLRDAYDIGAEFFRWEFAIAVAGAWMQINPFNQPNVQESKDNTKRVLESVGATLAVAQWENKQIAVYATGQIGGKGLRDALRAFFAQARAGNYLALMAYVSESESSQRALQWMRIAARDALKIATTLGYAPHFLHSTGQLHKGGPNNILALQITADTRGDVKIPGEKYSFGELQRAQSLGDWESLRAHQRRALRVHLKRGADLNALVKEWYAALNGEKNQTAKTPIARRKK